MSEPNAINGRAIIVGGGGAGMSAAIELCQAGVDCIILEADVKLGGATALCSGVFYAGGTRQQRENGIEDSTDAVYAYIMTLNQWDMRPDLVRILADKGPEGLEFLEAHGAKFPTDFLVGGGRTDRVARGHSCSGEGGTIAQHLASSVGRLPVEIRLGCRVKSLIEDAGRVVGVRTYDGEEILGSAVILTTGGFGNSREMVERLLPSIAQHGDRVWAVCEPAPFILGDGIRLAEDVGARITGFDHCLPLPTSGFAHAVEGVLPPWIMLVNLDGRRFMAETAAYSVSGYLINNQPESRTFAIFDDRTLNEVAADLSYTDPLKQGGVTPTWTPHDIRTEMERGRVISADSLSDLARALGIQPAALAHSVERYNSDCDRGTDAAFFKRTGLHAIREAPFYAVEVRASVVGVTGAGLDIDADARVIGEDNAVIAGLYAAGEVLGCMMGSRYSAGGISIATAVIFGRIAGQTAAADIMAVTATRMPRDLEFSS